MKGIKIVFPIMGIFLVIYVALVVMNNSKMNGIVSYLNKEYDENFVIIATTVGNVFTDDDFFVTARSENTGYKYEFEYNGGEITGNYELENKTIELTEWIENQLPEEAIAIVKLAGVEDPTVHNIEDLQFNDLIVYLVGDSKNIKAEKIEQDLSNTYDGVGSIEVSLLEASEAQIKKIKSELLEYVPISQIQREHIENYLY